MSGKVAEGGNGELLWSVKPPPPPPPPPPEALRLVPPPLGGGGGGGGGELGNQHSLPNFADGADSVAAAAAPPIVSCKKHPVVLSASEVAQLPNFQGAYNDSKIPPTPQKQQIGALGSSAKSSSADYCLCVKNRRTGRLTLFFRYFPMFAGFIGKEVEKESGDCDLVWVPKAPGTEVFFCTPFTLFGFRYKPIYRLGALSIRRTLEVSGIRLTGQNFAASVDEKGEANDWRLMWLQKNNHSGQDAEDFGGAWSCYTKVGFPIDYYKRIRTGADLERISASHNENDQAHDHARRSVSSPVRPWASQFINHFPGSEALDNKATMAACIRTAAETDPKAFSSGFPLSFCIPEDLEALAQHLSHTRNRGATNTENSSESFDLWLLKPPDLGGGHGIEVITANQLAVRVEVALSSQTTSTSPSTSEDRSNGGGSQEKPQLLSGKWVVQRYVAEPKLLDGFKHDLRLFFVVTSLDPLVVWSYPNAGIAKFCSSKYSRDPADLANAYVHLGNQCLNITNPEFHQEEGVDGQGPRWSLGAWRTRMESEGYDTELIQRKIDKLIAKVVIACQPRILEFMRGHGVIESQCYELFGIDVIVDSSGEPWLIEVNNTPGFGNNKTIDNTLFFPLIADTWTMLGIDMPNRPVDNMPPSSDNVVDRFEDQLARRRNLRCVFPSPQSLRTLLPLVKVRSAEAEELYAHVLETCAPAKNATIARAEP